jgi:hypothetical protein
VLSDIQGCGSYQIAEVTWPAQTQGANVWYAKVDINGETLVVASANALVASSINYLPVLFKAYSP